MSFFVDELSNKEIGNKKFIGKRRAISVIGKIIWNDLTKQLKNKGITLSSSLLLHYNMQGIKNKIQGLDLLLNSCLPNTKIFCLNEHNIGSENKNVLNKIPNYRMVGGYFRDQSRGGSCILVRNDLKCKVRDDLKCFNPLTAAF